MDLALLVCYVATLTSFRSFLCSSGHYKHILQLRDLTYKSCDLQKGFT